MYDIRYEKLSTRERIEARNFSIERGEKKKKKGIEEWKEIEGGLSNRLQSSVLCSPSPSNTALLRTIGKKPMIDCAMLKLVKLTSE